MFEEQPDWIRELYRDIYPEAMHPRLGQFRQRPNMGVIRPPQPQTPQPQPSQFQPQLPSQIRPRGLPGSGGLVPGPGAAGGLTTPTIPPNVLSPPPPMQDIQRQGTLGDLPAGVGPFSPPPPINTPPPAPINTPQPPPQAIGDLPTWLSNSGGGIMTRLTGSGIDDAERRRMATGDTNPLGFLNPFGGYARDLPRRRQSRELNSIEMLLEAILGRR